MPIIAKKTSGDFERAPLGAQPAVCVFVEDVGYEPDMKGELKRKCVILWELKALMRDERPFMLSKSYTVSLHEKANLRKDLESWRGKVFSEEELNGFDLEKLKGANCLLNVIEHRKQNGDVINIVGTVMALAKGTERLVPLSTAPPEWVAKRRAENAKNQPAAESARVAEPVAVTDDDSPPF